MSAYNHFCVQQETKINKFKRIRSCENGETRNIHFIFIYLYQILLLLLFYLFYFFIIQSRSTLEYPIIFCIRIQKNCSQPVRTFVGTSRLP